MSDATLQAPNQRALVEVDVSFHPARAAPTLPDHPERPLPLAAPDEYSSEECHGA